MLFRRYSRIMNAEIKTVEDNYSIVKKTEIKTWLMTFFLNKNIFLDFLPFCGGEKPGSGAGNPSVGRKSLGWGGESRMGDRKLDNLGGGIRVANEISDFLHSYFHI